MARIFSNAAIYIIAFFAVTISFYALSYYFMQHGFILSKGETASVLYWKVAFYTHVGSGAVALGIGWLQFLKKFRRRNIGRHRTIGKIYVIAILFFASTSGMVLAFNASEGFVTKVGFGCLAFAWFYSTLNAWLSIQKGKVQQHHTWMVRSYAITMAAITLRIWLPLSFAFGLSFSQSYPAISWFCWVPNLLVVEWFIVPRIKKPAYAPMVIE
jgi:hypothetical protein